MSKKSASEKCEVSCRGTDLMSVRFFAWRCVGCLCLVCLSVEKKTKSIRMIVFGEFINESLHKK